MDCLFVWALFVASSGSLSLLWLFVSSDRGGRGYGGRGDGKKRKGFDSNNPAKYLSPQGWHLLNSEEKKSSRDTRQAKGIKTKQIATVSTGGDNTTSSDESR